MSLVRTVLDWETAYGKHSVTGENITLSKQTTEEYIRSDYFKAHGLGVKIEDDRAFYVYGKDLIRFLKTHPWERTFAICHHTHFDGAIFSWRAGIRPAFWGCTLSMARAIYPHESGSLSNIAKLLGVGEKGIELANFAGKWNLTAEEQKILGSYCCNDVDLTADIFAALKTHFPPSELRLIDLTIRLFTEPVLRVDRQVLLEDFRRERRNKRALLKACATDKSVLASGDQFAALLLTLGVDPPKKLSPSKVKDGRVNPDNVGEPPLGLLPSFKLPAGAPVLLSKEEIAALKVQLKTEKDTYPWSYAFGKADEAFKALNDHPDPQVQAVVEARLGVKSTIKETRSKRFFKIGGRGAFPVYLSYYAARTGRWGGGDKTNAQNMGRVDPRDPTSGALRRSWVAPAGHVLVVRDLGQIEARVAAYLAGQEDLLELFRTGGDPYNRQASLIFGYEVDRKLKQFWLEGMAGKAAVLGCFGADTKVLTNRGWVDMVQVRATDTVWDGMEFVTHAGVVQQGVKECLTAFGVNATPDHAILTEHSWAEWQSVLTSPSLFQSALHKASLPSLSGRVGGAQKDGWMDGIHGVNVLVDGKGSSNGRILRWRVLRGVITALRRQLESFVRTTLDTLRSFPTHITESDYSTAYQRVSSGATTQKISSLCTMVGGVFSSLSSGVSTVKNFSPIWSHSLAGMSPTTSLTERTTTKGTSQGISGSLLKRRTPQTKALLESCGESTPYSKQRMMTYDIAYAGPRNRFTILSTAGPLIVHNCGYSMGWGKFQESLRVGFMGMPSLMFDADAARKVGADIEVFCHQRSYKKGCAFLQEEALEMKPLNVEPIPHLWHCAAVKQIVDKYRQSNADIVALWAESGRALHSIVRGETIPVGKRGLITTCGEGFLMPNGMKIRYHKLRVNDAGEFRYLANARKKEWSYLYGGKCVENQVQALSRTILSDQMLNIDKWVRQQRAADPGMTYSVVTSTHDEVVCCVPEYRADDCLEMMKVEMATAPAWCPDLPLKSSGGYAVSYGDCEK